MVGTRSIGAKCDDCVKGIACALPVDMIIEQGGQFKFANAGLDLGYRLAECRDGNAHGLAGELVFPGILYATQALD